MTETACSDPAPDVKPTPDEFLQAALDYAARGWPVIPLFEPTASGCSCGVADCPAVGKHPRIKLGRGLAAASTDPDRIRRWWDKWPNANIGIVTGRRSGLLIIDIDRRHNGPANLEALRNGRPWPATASVRTGDGVHYYFRHPGGATKMPAKLAPGVDVKSDGGYVVGVPSMHGSGRRYVWLP